MKYQSIRRQRDRAKQRLDRTIPELDRTFPVVLPKLPWYAGASDHFGDVKSQYYAKQFFANL